MRQNQELLEKIVQRIGSFEAQMWKRIKASHETGSAYVLHDRGYRYILEKWQGQGCEIDIGSCSRDCDHREYDLRVLDNQNREVIRAYYLDMGVLIEIYQAIEDEEQRRFQQENKEKEEKEESSQDKLLRNLKR